MDSLVKNFSNSGDLEEMVKYIPPAALKYYEAGDKKSLSEEMNQFYELHASPKHENCVIGFTGFSLGVATGWFYSLITGDLIGGRQLATYLSLTGMIISVLTNMVNNYHHLKKFNDNLSVLLESSGSEPKNL